jgi:hypothetical protein
VFWLLRLAQSLRAEWNILLSALSVNMLWLYFLRALLSVFYCGLTLILEGLFAGARVGEQQLVVADVAVVTIQRGEGVGGFFEHLLGHGDRIAELLEIQR